MLCNYSYPASNKQLPIKNAEMGHVETGYFTVSRHWHPSCFLTEKDTKLHTNLGPRITTWGRLMHEMIFLKKRFSSLNILLSSFLLFFFFLFMHLIASLYFFSLLVLFNSCLLYIVHRIFQFISLTVFYIHR